MIQLGFNIVLMAMKLLLISLSFSVIYYPTKFFHLAHAVIITAAAYFVFLFSRQLDMSLWFSIPLGVLCTTAIGLFCEICLYKPLRKRSSSPMILMIASLGLYTVLQNVISITWGDNTQSIRIGEIKIGHEFLGAYITTIQVITIVVCLLSFIATLLFLKYHKIGRDIRAVASNSELSNIVGVNSDRTILWAFGIGSALAAIVGLLIAFDVNMTPTMGFNWLLYGIVAMIISGVGSNWGLIGGALLLATSQHLVAYYIGSQWMDAIAYIILILFLVWRPLGFSGKRLKKVEI